MSIANAILQKPKVVILLGSSGSGISANSFLFGLVYNIYQTSNSFAINDSVMFNPQKATQISDSTGSNYYLIDESELFFKEVVSPPL